MGHKTHPLGFRLGITQDHKSMWHSNLNRYAKHIQEDFTIRNRILDSLSGDPELKSTGITKILLNRSPLNQKIDIEVHSAKPGNLVGLKGSNLKLIYQDFNKLFPTKKIRFDIVEIKEPEIFFHADLVADMLVIQLESRIPFRRAMKIILDELRLKQIQGVKIQIAGRVNGAEIARTEWLREGRVPLQTLRANIDYSYKTAQTVYGILGIKVWLFKGNIFAQNRV